MKKIISLALSVVMILSALVILSGCGKAKLPGTWKAEVDMAPLLAGELGEDVKLDKMPVNYTLTLNEDNTFKTELDAESLKAAFEAAKPAITKAMEDSLKEELGGGEDVDIDSLLSELGMSKDDLLDSVLEMFTSDEAIAELKEEADMEGKYEVEDNKMYFAKDGEEIDKDAYLEFELGKTLKITKDVDVGMFDEITPIELTK